LTTTLELTIVGHDLPGAICGPSRNVHVALQLGSEPAGLVRADASEARWHTEVRVDASDEGFEFRGPAVHGRRGDRFVYLTWGTVDDDSFNMFRRAKLMLNRIDVALVRRALSAGHTLVATVHLTDPTGMPRCARVDPPAIVWRVDAA
jgi:hypothetical protein